MRSQAASFGSRRERKSDKPISPGGSSCLTRADIENWLQGTNGDNNVEENRVVPRSHQKQKDHSSSQGLPRPPNTRLRSQAASFGRQRESKRDEPISHGSSSCLSRADIENWLQGTNVNNNLEENRVVRRSHQRQTDHSFYQGLPRPPNTGLTQGKKERERDIPSGTNRPGSRQHNMRIRQADESRPTEFASRVPSVWQTGPYLVKGNAGVIIHE